MKLCLVWHMHQPDYREPGSNRAVMPWVRLHALKDYLDMVRIAAQHRARVTFNLTPVLLMQLEETARGALGDDFLRLTETPAEALTEADRRFILDHFFRVNEARIIAPLPRYAELHARRQSGVSGFSVAELRDLQVLFQLGWSGPELRRRPAVAALLERGRNFSEADKAALLDESRAHIAETLAAYGEAWREGIIEISTTPLYHPILPLLIDLEQAVEAKPDTDLQGCHYRFPADARAQIELGLGRAEALLGTRPVGLWPSEGSLSEDVLAMLAKTRLAWCGADEQILRRSVSGGPASHLRPWRLRGEGPALFFRDTHLSDLIGFSYARMPAKAAAKDFVQRARALAARHERGPEHAVVTVILDGENCWEYYPDNGEPFLHALYEALDEAEDITLATPSDVLASGLTPSRLPRLAPGSWIRGTFDTWAGHPDKNRAWMLLAEVREEVEDVLRHGPLPERALESLLRAEGSDWFWWLGDDNPTAYLMEFESLFRGHLRAVCEAIGRPAPPGLARPIPSTEDSAIEVEPPTALVRPRIDGRSVRYFEWIGSGRFRVVEQGGTMRVGHKALCRELHFGFDEGRLYLRLTPAEGRREALRGAELRISLEFEGGALDASGSEEKSALARLDLAQLQPGIPLELDADSESGPVTIAALDEVLELAIDRAAAGLAGGVVFGLGVLVESPDGVSQRLPQNGWIRTRAPDERFNALHWTV